MKKIFIGIICFLIAGVGGFFGIQYLFKNGILGKPGEMVFSEDFPEDEKEFYSSLLDENEKLRKNVSLSFTTLTSTATDSSENERKVLVDVLVPVDDFYSSVERISEDELLEREGRGELISINNLDSSEKLLGVGDKYFLDDFSSGAVFKYLVIQGDNEEDLDLVSEKVAVDLPTKATTLSFAQTGVTAFGRGMNQMMDAVGDGKYFSEKIGGFLRSFDLTHTSNEASFSQSANSTNICADERFMDALIDLGIDIVELTGNHNLDCGAEDAISTIEKYKANGMRIVGGGKDATEAAEPLETSLKGSGITMLAYNQSTGGATDGDEPGANRYNEQDAKDRISEAKAKGDIVIVDMQYFECSEYDSAIENTTCDYADSSDGDQIGLFRALVEMGADVVVGTSAHQTQTFEKYNNGEIYYGLGNIFFDQSWWPGTTRSLGLVHYFWNGKLIQTRRFGTVYDGNLQTRLMNDEEMEYFIERLNNARPEYEGQ